MEAKARIMEKLEKLESYDLDWVECMINHLIARTRQPSEPPRIAEQPDPAEIGHAGRTAAHGQGEGFDSKRGIPLGTSVKFLPECRFQYTGGRVVKCNNPDNERYTAPCSKRCESPDPPLGGGDDPQA